MSEGVSKDFVKTKFEALEKHLESLEKSLEKNTSCIVTHKTQIAKLETRLDDYIEADRATDNIRDDHRKEMKEDTKEGSRVKISIFNVVIATGMLIFGGVTLYNQFFGG